MALTTKEIAEEFEAALSDAGIEKGRARLYLVEKMGDGDLGAVWHRPGRELAVHKDFPDRSQLQDANATDHRDLHRIVAPANPPNAVTLAALLRHELEHARQYDALGEQFLGLQDFIEDGVL